MSVVFFGVGCCDWLCATAPRHGLGNPCGECGVLQPHPGVRTQRLAEAGVRRRSGLPCVLFVRLPRASFLLSFYRGLGTWSLSAVPVHVFLFFSFFGGWVLWAVSVAEFSNRDDMSRAVRELDDTYFADRRIRVDYVSARVLMRVFCRRRARFEPRSA